MLHTATIYVGPSQYVYITLMETKPGAMTHCHPNTYYLTILPSSFLQGNFDK